MSKELYQKLYDTTRYGKSETNCSPEYRHFNLYKDYLEAPVISLGCGRGDTVDLMNKHGIFAAGIDQITCNARMLTGDICKPLSLLEDNSFSTALCFDVFEHILDPELLGLIENMKKCKRQVFSIFIGSGGQWLEKEHEELHINIKTNEGWKDMIKKHFKIINIIEVTPKYLIFFTTNL